MRCLLKTLTAKLTCLIALILSGVLIQPGCVWSAEKQVVGWIENAVLFPGNLEIKAKLDTGAENSSIHVDQIYEFKRDGQNWVRFTVANRQGCRQTFETRIIRTAEIKRHGSTSQKRPVVRLGVCLGAVYKEVEVNLTDRSSFDFRMLIGRSFLEGAFVVDSEKTFTVQTKCREAGSQ